MRKLICLLVFAGLTACGGGDGTLVGPLAGTDACNTNGQKQYVLDQLYLWYLWNDLLPAGINIGDYASAEELVTRVTLELGPKDTNGDPIDFFSSVGSLQADTEFFSEGKYEGFGFSWRFVDAALTDFRITRTFSGSPAAAELGRGDQVLTLDTRAVGDIQAAEGLSAFFAANDTIVFEVQTVAGSISTPTISKAVVTIDPVPQWWVRDVNGRNVGYLELSTFISTADSDFDMAFQDFFDADVAEVIIDLRYNGGGLVSTANLLGDYLGGLVAKNQRIFSRTEFNADRANNNEIKYFENIANRSVGLSRLVVIATQNTASASELVTNGLIPHVDVAIVGDRTFGKPVGQIGIEFCDKILRPTSFRLANELGDGDYFDGLPATCLAADDLSVAIGDDLDPNMIAAMSYLNTGACPVVTTAPASQFKASAEIRALGSEPNAPPHRELLGAY